MRQELNLNQDTLSGSESNNSFITSDSERSKLVPMHELDEEAKRIKEKFRKIDEEKIAKKLEEQFKQTTDLHSSIFSISNTIMGTGCLALPYTISQWGPLIGTSLMILFFFMNVYTSELCIKACRLTGFLSFSAISKKAFGRGGSIIVKIGIIITNFGATLIYFTILASGWPNLIKKAGDNILTNHAFFTALLGIIYFPTAFLRELRILSKISIIGVLSMISYTLSVIYLLVDHINKGEVDVKVVRVSGSIKMITSIPNIILAYVYQFNIYPIYKELKNPTKERMRTAFTLGLLIVVIIYAITANIGYILYDIDTKPNIIDNYTSESGAANLILNFSVLINVTMSLPLVFFECRNNTLLIIDEIKEWRKRRKMKLISPDNSPDGIYNSPTDIRKEKLLRKPENKMMFYVTTSIVYIIIVTIVMVYPKIQTMFTLTGAVGCNSVAIIIPAAFILTLSKEPILSREKLLPLILVIVGFALMFLCVVALLYDLSSS